ncbi:sulfotransferase 6B1-like [Pelobates fuscus]|uniref:sulfotransferase 6B1-like n=1 Tax=Pelobates fuscus TaxID=191477 RepID=UPI002FE4B35E
MMSTLKQKPRTERDKFLEAIVKVAGDASKKSAEELLFRYKGVLYPIYICSEATFQAVQSLEAREDDMFIATYPKCGTNWITQVLHEVVYFTHNREPLLEDAMLEFGEPEKVESITRQASPRIFSTHLYYNDMPKSFIENKSKILWILRNPKDTAVSFYHFCNNNPILPTYHSWDSFFQDYMNAKVCYGSYFDHALSWNEHIDEENIMAVTFEEIKEDFAKQLKKICKFFGLHLTNEQINKIENKTTFKSMKEKSNETHGEFGDLMFRKGEIGDWRSLFTEEQSREMDAKFEERLAGTKVGKKLNYNKYCKF